MWSTVDTASARFSGSTATENSLFEAAAIDLAVDDDGGQDTRLLVDADGLYPGLVIERCLVVTHRGTLDDVAVRLHGSGDGDSGLAPFLRTQIDLGAGMEPDCSDFRTSVPAFSGRLSDLWQAHATFADGVDLMPTAADGDAITVRLAFEVADDDRAQGLQASFTVIVEARP